MQFRHSASTTLQLRRHHLKNFILLKSRRNWPMALPGGPTKCLNPLMSIVICFGGQNKAVTFFDHRNEKALPVHANREAGLGASIVNYETVELKDFNGFGLSLGVLADGEVVLAYLD